MCLRARVCDWQIKDDLYLTDKFDVSVLNQPPCPIFHESHIAWVEFVFKHKFPEIELNIGSHIIAKIKNIVITSVLICSPSNKICITYTY